ncbi:hypothetical protein DFQ27_001920 [Actinomortierella ambigua]|uniref:Uncharacterized protein n=1 Tax=Actinomortierella ambigua TaxID=1343610 RepID=A0A9P6QDD8_9FUNG|nr:hypothetical protein DFQ27_001920 [Actinomortierella ambigua]
MDAKKMDRLDDGAGTRAKEKQQDEDDLQQQLREPMSHNPFSPQAKTQHASPTPPRQPSPTLSTPEEEVLACAELQARYLSGDLHSSDDEQVIALIDRIHLIENSIYGTPERPGFLPGEALSALADSNIVLDTQDPL